VLGRLLEAARGGHGGVLVVHGEPGVGKTALVEDAVQAGRVFRVARTAGVEGEMELAYAALQQLCAPILELTERLPQPQRDALAVAFGHRAGPTPNPFLVGLAALGLLSEAAEERPLLCVVDDAQWLDRASARALGFVARRLLAEKIALVFAARELSEALAGFPELHVGPLGHRDAHALLESALPARLDEQVLERIIVETHGNPLALLELPRGLTPTQLAGGLGCPRHCLCPPGSRRASPGGWRGSQWMRGACCSWPRPTQSAIWRWCGGPCSGSAFPSRPRRRSNRTAWWRSVPVSCSGIHWFARRSTGQPERRSGARPTAPSRTRPIQPSTRIAAPGTGPRRQLCPMRKSPRSSNGRQPEPRRGAASPAPRPSSSAPRC
jgi:hypothetical protein